MCLENAGILRSLLYYCVNVKNTFIELAGWGQNSHHGWEVNNSATIQKSWGPSRILTAHCLGSLARIVRTHQQMGVFENGETMTNHDKYNTKTGPLVSTGLTPKWPC